MEGFENKEVTLKVTKLELEVLNALAGMAARDAILDHISRLQNRELTKADVAEINQAWETVSDKINDAL